MQVNGGSSTDKLKGRKKEKGITTAHTMPVQIQGESHRDTPYMQRLDEA